MKPVQFVAPEEAARANFYALLARLFYAPPDRALLDALAKSGTLQAEEGALAETWNALCEAARSADPEELRDEYDTVFVGTGKAPVTLYTIAYSIRYANESPLVELRGDLARLGLGRRAQAGEPEDHISGLCDTMRWLVAEQQSRIEEQKRFFTRWIAPSIEPLCAAIEKNGRTRFYKHVGRFAQAFCKVEHMSFEML